VHSSLLSKQSNQTTPITVKVVYLAMSTQTSGIKQEYFTLPSPAYLDNVLTQIKEAHPSFAAMLPSMQIVVNGVPTQDNPLLSNNSEVDFIPVYAGG
jgi:molybdopterin converting factor small subunit